MSWIIVSCHWIIAMNHCPPLVLRMTPERIKPSPRTFWLLTLCPHMTTRGNWSPIVSQNIFVPEGDGQAYE